jgi:hypothetical protein
MDALRRATPEDAADCGQDLLRRIPHHQWCDLRRISGRDADNLDRTH